MTQGPLRRQAPVMGQFSRVLHGSFRAEARSFASLRMTARAVMTAPAARKVAQVRVRRAGRRGARKETGARRNTGLRIRLPDRKGQRPTACLPTSAKPVDNLDYLQTAVRATGGN